MKVTLKIKRFNPEKDEKPWWAEYAVEAEPTDRLLDALNAVKWYQDGTLSYRRSCAHGICGSDAMLINGSNALACKALLKNLGDTITVEPMRGFRVVKDLMVDLEPFFDGSAKVLRAGDLVAHVDVVGPDACGEQLLHQQLHDRPSFWANPEYVGPAAIVNAHRFIFDSRDEGREERLEILNHRDGVWRCRTIFNCVEACPRGINVTRAIGEVKQALMYRKL